MQKIIVAAKSNNQVIGKENRLAWHLPADLRFFMATIEGAFLVTGRKSYESAQGEEVFGPHRQFAIITRNKNYQAKHGQVVHSLQAAIKLAKESGAQRLCILGGAAIYKEAMSTADQMILTEVHANFEGDTFFPAIDPNHWVEVSRIKYTKDTANQFDYSFVVYKRINSIKMNINS